MKINYPVKYTAMPIVKSVGWGIGLNELEKEYGVVCYIVSKCYLLSDLTRYKENGQSTKEYEVVFPYQYDEIYSRKWERTIPTFNCYNDNCDNSNIVEKVFDSYEEALEFTITKNNKLCEKTWINLPCTKDMIQKISDKVNQFNYMLARYKMLEQQILYHTSDIKQSNTKELKRLISIKNSKGKVISGNLYEFLRFTYDNTFIVYSVSEEQYDKLRELTKEESISDVTSIIGPVNAILYHDSKEPIIRIISPNIDDVYYFEESELLRHNNKFKKVTQKELDNVDEKTYHFYTTEKVEDIMASFRIHDDIDLEKVQGPLLIKKKNN